MRVTVNRNHHGRGQRSGMARHRFAARLQRFANFVQQSLVARHFQQALLAAIAVFYMIGGRSEFSTVFVVVQYDFQTTIMISHHLSATSALRRGVSPEYGRDRYTPHWLSDPIARATCLSSCSSTAVIQNAFQVPSFTLLRTLSAAQRNSSRRCSIPICYSAHLVLLVI